MTRFSVVLVVVFLLPTILRAAEPAHKTSISFISFVEIERSDSDTELLLSTVVHNLSRYKGFDYIPIERLIDKKGFSTFYSDFRRATRFLAEGKLHYENMDFESSLSSFSKAIQIFEKNNLFINKRTYYLESLSYVGAISVLTKKIDNAYKSFRRIVTIDQQYRLNEDIFPPQIVEIFKKVAKEVLATPKCIVRFRTDPDRSQVYLNGELIGLSPLDRSGLVCGDHYYSILMPGYYPVSGSFSVDQERIKIDLSESLKATDNLGLLEEIQNQIRQSIETDDYPEILTLLSDVDQLIIVFVTGTNEKPVLTGILYDNIGKIRINSNSVVLNKPIAYSVNEIDSFITSVYLDIGGRKIFVQPFLLPTTGQDESGISKEKKAIERESPIYTKWWFWLTIVSGIAILITVPVIVINSAESGGSSDDHLDPFLRK